MTRAEIGLQQVSAEPHDQGWACPWPHPLSEGQTVRRWDARQDLEPCVSACTQAWHDGLASALVV